MKLSFATCFLVNITSFAFIVPSHSKSQFSFSEAHSSYGLSLIHAHNQCLLNYIYRNQKVLKKSGFVLYLIPKMFYIFICNLFYHNSNFLQFYLFLNLRIFKLMNYSCTRFLLIFKDISSLYFDQYEGGIQNSYDFMGYRFFSF